jgi:hypothetical protein
MTEPSCAAAAERTAALDRDQTLVKQLRRIALHQETAALLELRAGRATSPTEAALLRRRAATRRSTAQQLRAQLAAQRRPSTVDRDADAGRPHIQARS